VRCEHEHALPGADHAACFLSRLVQAAACAAVRNDGSTGMSRHYAVGMASMPVPQGDLASARGCRPARSAQRFCCRTHTRRAACRGSRRGRR
jgi:hypothetical protein